MHLIILAVITVVVNRVHCSNSTSLDDTCDIDGPGPWSALLEEWATSAVERPGRQDPFNYAWTYLSKNGLYYVGRIMALSSSSGYYITDRIDTPLMTPPAPRPAARPYEEWAVTPPPPPGPGKIVNRPPNPYKDKFKPSYEYNPPPIPAYPHQQPQRPNTIDRVDEPPRKQVTETDLYLLSAIEKLVYRADLMEKRLRKLEESMHVLVAGSTPQAEPCVTNFTRVGETCYHFSPEASDWKSANLACRKLRANLIELEAEPERRKVFAHMLSDKKLKALDWWTGGLNPGLLWIWSNSARPVAGDAKNSTVTIVGDGRCLALIYDPAVRTYVYRGQDCALRHRFVCEKGEDKAKLSNEIEAVSHKKLSLETTTPAVKPS